MKCKSIQSRIFTMILAGAFVVGAVPHLQAREADGKTCSVTTVQGTYSFVTTGTLDGAPFASVGRVTFDGKGNSQGSGTISNNGVIFRDVPFTGTYTVNPDCTGSSTVSTGREVDFVINHYGSEIQSINTAPETVLVTILKKQHAKATGASQNNREATQREQSDFNPAP